MAKIPDSMTYVRVPSIKSAKGIWQEDKKLIRLAGLDCDGDLPDENLVERVREVVFSRVRSPQDPLELSDTIIVDLISHLIPELEQVWGCELSPMRVEVIPPEHYLARIHHFERKVNAAVGFGGLTTEVPTAYLLAAEGKLLISTLYHGKPWERHYLEQILAEEVSHALFRQGRGEWQDGYVAAINAVGPDFQVRISLLNEAIA